MTNQLTHSTENTRPGRANGKAQVLVVDRHPLVRDGLLRLLANHPDLICCGQAATAPEALAAVQAAHPDLVILDLRLRGGGGLDLIKSLRARFSDLLILVLSQDDEPAHIESALQAGAQGYLIIERAADELFNAIRTLLAGETYPSQGMAALLWPPSLARRAPRYD